MLNFIILYQNVSCVSGIDYLACMRKKSEIIEDLSVILSYTKAYVIIESTTECDLTALPFLYSFMHWKCW